MTWDKRPRRLRSAPGHHRRKQQKSPILPVSYRAIGLSAATVSRQQDSRPDRGVLQEIVEV